jgi:hypothetical protein
MDDLQAIFGQDLDALPGDEEFEMDVETEVVTGIRALVSLQQQQIALLQVIAQRLGPKRIARDSSGNILGVEPVQG